MTYLSKTSVKNLTVNVFYDAKTRCSFCWKYFGHLVLEEGNKKKILNTDQVFCLACLVAVKKVNEDITFGSVKIKSYNKTVSTGNLTRHLRDDHKIREDFSEDSKTAVIDAINALGHRKFGGSTSSTSKASSRNGNSCNDMAKDLVLWFCQSLLPFDSVCDEGMVEFFKKYNIISTDEDIPSFHTVSGPALSDVYESILSKVKDNISTDAAQNSALTLDVWSDQHRGFNFITFTLHYLTSDFTLKTFTLSTEIIAAKKIEQNINEAMKEIRKNFGLNDTYIIAVTDSRSYIRQAVSLANFTHHLCLGQGFHNLVTVDGINSVPEIAALVQKCKKIVKSLRYFVSELPAEDNKIQQQLELLCSLDRIVESLERDERDPIPEVDLTPFNYVKEFENDISTTESSSGHCTHIPITKTATSTRWHIVLEMLEIVKQACNPEPINNLLTKIGEEELRITEGEWIILEELVNFLKRFQEVVQIISSQKTCSLNVALVFRSEIIDILNSVDDDESITLLRLKRNMMANINKRFPVTKTIIAAALLDNRFISLKEVDVFLENHNMTRTSFLSSFIKELVSFDSIPEIKAKSSSCTTGSSNEVEASLLHKLSKKHSISGLRHGIQEDPIEQECWRYIAQADPLEPKDGDLLSYWDNRKKLFPHLSALAKAVLCIPATSTPHDRMFAEAGLTISSKRSRLSPFRVNKIIFIHDNYGKLTDTQTG